MTHAIEVDLRAFADDFADKRPPDRLLLDANIVFALQMHEMAMGPKPKGFPGPYGKRNAALVGFLTRARAAGCELFVTPSVVVEVFHVCCRKALRPAMEQHRCDDPKELRWKHREAFVAAKETAAKAMRAALRAVEKHGVVLHAPVGEDSRSLGRKLVAAFATLVERVPEVGAQDALHVVTATALGCKGFASNDGDFRFLKDGCVIYCENPSSVVR